MENKYILVTGGLGYLGSHMCVSLLEQNKKIVIVDNLVNSDISVRDRIAAITGEKPEFVHCDLRDYEKLRAVFQTYPIQSVIHFAALKAVNESIEKPVEYYDNNVNGMIQLLKCIEEFQVEEVIYSSSATVYGVNNEPPFKENMLRSAVNVYGNTKIIGEDLLIDYHTAHLNTKVAILRYFNPLGAHVSGLLGEIADEHPVNLMPYITKVAAGKLEKLHVFGDDYDTKDGTCIRDFIHVSDLVSGHIRALEYLQETENTLEIINLGSGVGYSVLELIHVFEETTGMDIPYEIDGRRPGDVGVSFSNIDKAIRLLHWKPEKTLEDMCRDSWNWEKSNR